jgi:hypothetical protein
MKERQAMQEGSRSPWGKIQDVRELAEGAWMVSTAGHGGIKLSAARNRKVPAPAREPGGWYEEDCQWAIAAHVHKDVQAAMLAGARKSDPARFGPTYVAEVVKRWESPEVCAALGL